MWFFIVPSRKQVKARVASVHVKWSSQGRSYMRSTSIKVPLDAWDSDAQRIKQVKLLSSRFITIINEQLDLLANRLNLYFAAALKDGKPIDLTIIQKIIDYQDLD